MPTDAGTVAGLLFVASSGTRCFQNPNISINDVVVVVVVPVAAVAVVVFVSVFFFVVLWS